MKSDSVRAQLDILQKRADRIEFAIVGVWLIATIVAVAALYEYYAATPAGIVGHMVEMPVLAIAVAGMLLQIGRGLSVAICTRFAPSYFVEERGDVLLVWGGIPLTKFSSVKTQLLSLRPDYVWLPGESAYREYGCALAAVKSASH